MKTWIKILIILAVIGLIAAFIVWKFVINKPHPDYAKAKADMEVIASDLFTQYTTKKADADKSFTGKEIQLKGQFSKIEQNGTVAIVIFIFRQGDFGDEGVRCVLLPDEIAKIKNIKPNQEIIIKGFCTGYNETDVIVDKCVFVNL
jgi:hypothetical protein